MTTRVYDKKLWKKCIKCRSWRPRQDIEMEDGTLKKKGFGDHNSSDGLQSICFRCKNDANTKSRERNVSARIRHHTATRCLTQLGEMAPEGFTKDLEDHLGYRIRLLVRHLSADLKEREGHGRKLKDALNEGYHIDHIKPLSSFNVIVKSAGMGSTVDWDEFRRCWAIENLSAIPAHENLAKGAKYDKDADADASGNEEVVITREKEVTAEIVPNTESNNTPESLSGDNKE